MNPKQFALPSMVLQKFDKRQLLPNLALNSLTLVVTPVMMKSCHFQMNHMEITSPESLSSIQDDRLVQMLQTAQYNWFELVNKMEEMGIQPSSLERRYEQLSASLAERERELLRQSHASYLMLKQSTCLSNFEKRLQLMGR